VEDKIEILETKLHVAAPVYKGGEKSPSSPRCALSACAVACQLEVEEGRVVEGGGGGGDYRKPGSRKEKS